jgi:hypothetical protein
VLGLVGLAGLQRVVLRGVTLQAGPVLQDSTGSPAAVPHLLMLRCATLCTCPPAALLGLASPQQHEQQKQRRPLALLPPGLGLLQPLLLLTAAG